jgi:putative peptidoglycan lipid II flippase
LTTTYLFRKVRTLSFGFDWKDSGVRAALRQFAPQLFSSSINQINQIADKSMATLLGIGRVSALSYSSRLIIFLPEIFLSSFGRTLLPTLSEQVSREQFDEIKQMLNSAFRWILFLLLPVVCATIILRLHIVGLLFERGSFTADNTRLTAFALAFYAPSILLVTINICIRRTIFALQQSAFIARIGFVGVGFNVLMNFILMQFIDVGGLALATTLSSLLHLVASYWFLTTKLGKIHDETLPGGLVKIGLGCAVMSVVLLLAPGWLAEVMPADSTGTKLAFLITISLAGGLTYLGVARLLRIEELGKLFAIVMRKGRGSNTG